MARFTPIPPSAEKAPAEVMLRLVVWPTVLASMVLPLFAPVAVTVMAPFTLRSSTFAAFRLIGALKVMVLFAPVVR